MPPILSHTHYDAASTFKPENLLREARRQKGLPEAPVPEICILDPDGDMVRYLCNAGVADGAKESLRVIALAVASWRAKRCDHESL